MFPAFPIQIVIALLIAGLILWILQQIPIDAAIARIIRVVVIVCVAIWLISILLSFAGYPVFRR